MAKDPYEIFQLPTPDLQVEIEQNVLSTKRLLCITGESVTYDSKIMHFKDIEAIRFGAWSPRNGVDYFFAFKEKSGREMTVAWHSIGGSIEVSAGTYKRIDDKLMETFGLAMMRTFHATLKAGNEINLKIFRATRGGLYYEKKRWFSKREIFVSWGNLGLAKGDAPGQIIIGNRQDKSTHTAIILGFEWNLNYLLRYGDQLKAVSSMSAELKG
jgi:hypothetical protein